MKKEIIVSSHNSFSKSTIRSAQLTHSVQHMLDTTCYEVRVNKCKKVQYLSRERERTNA